MSSNIKSQRILKNTLVLYGRMLITMVIALFTSRVLLQALGISDYGLYNVVGGVVSLFSFLMSSMASATQRFLSFELGRGDHNTLSDVFSMSLTTHILIALVVLVLSETIGLWFLNTYIQVPEGRLFAANFIYQFIVLSLCLNIIIVPYSACVITHEDMNIYAYISIFDSVAKLIVAYLLYISMFDRLCLYGVLLCVITVLDFIFYYSVCRKKYQESKYRYFFDKKLFLRIFSFSGWTVLGQMSVVGASHGTSILLNIYHSVVYNAALGIANQVNGALNGLVSNFQTAFQPQITKSYSSEEYDYMYKLIYNASKISFFLLFLVSIPVIINIDWLLAIWLKDVPPSTNVFCILFLTSSLLNSIGGPLWMSIFATGNIKTYQIFIFIAYALSLLGVFLAFMFGAGPEIGVAINALISVVILLIRLIFVKIRLPIFSWRHYLKSVFFPISACVSIVLFVYFMISSFNLIENKILLTLIICLTSILSVLYIGLSKEEKRNLIGLVIKKIKIKL